MKRSCFYGEGTWAARAPEAPQRTTTRREATWTNDDYVRARCVWRRPFVYFSAGSCRAFVTPGRDGVNTYEIFLRRCDWPARRFSHLDALAGELPRSRRCVVVDCHDPGGIDQYLSLQDRLGDGPSVLLLPSHCPASRIAKTCRGHTQILHKVPDTSTLLRAVESAARCASGSS